MDYNFDEIIDRKDTDSIKYDFALKRGKPEDILPLWVADMDFKTPQPVIDALTEAALHGIYGYSESREDYMAVLKAWFLIRFNWTIKDQWLVKTPGVVFAINIAIRAYTKEQDGILIQEPVYYPFRESIETNNRKVVVNQLRYEQRQYTVDFEDFENKIINEQVKMMILCNPHNPVGRVWRKEELIKMADICLAHNVLILSDEIHADFIYEPYQHLVLADLKPEYLEKTITLTAPSKTFNLAGLQISNVFIANGTLRKQFREAYHISGYSQLSSMGIVACRAAYAHGEDWLEQLKLYLAENLNYIRTYLKEHLPEVHLIEPEGTYLVWIDCSRVKERLEINDQQLDELIVNKGKLWLDDGNMFGLGGSGFQRINMACPRALLEKAMKQLSIAFK